MARVSSADPVRAYMWLELAWTGAGSEFTRELYARQRDELASEMTAEQIGEAQRLGARVDARNRAVTGGGDGCSEFFAELRHAQRVRRWVRMVSLKLARSRSRISGGTYV